MCHHHLGWFSPSSSPLMLILQQLHTVHCKGCFLMRCRSPSARWGWPPSARLLPMWCPALSCPDWLLVLQRGSHRLDTWTVQCATEILCPETLECELTNFITKNILQKSEEDFFKNWNGTASSSRVKDTVPSILRQVMTKEKIREMLLRR